MANPEHLEILAKGVRKWNEWREHNPDVIPDLVHADLCGAKARLGWVDLGGAKLGWVNPSGAELSEADLLIAKLRGAEVSHTDLSGADLSRADLRGAYLVGAKLKAAKLSDADLGGAHLSRADLGGAHLVGATLGAAKLNGADLGGADLGGADLSGADFSGADLREADLGGADLGGADLSGADLRGANLSGADLNWAYLVEAKLRAAKLSGADLSRANLSGADLEKTVLISCRLVTADLTGAELTGAKLYGTARDDWTIKDIKCRYVYWDARGEQRSPRDRDLEPGEFERLYATLPTIEYIFENGMAPLDPLIMDRVVQAIRDKKPEYDIKIDSINARGLAPSIKFTVQQEEHKEAALEEVAKEYDTRLKRLEAEKDRLYQLLGQAIDKAGMKLIAAGPGSIVATDGSTINVEQHINNAVELQKAIAEQPEDSETFAKVAKKTALNILSDALKDFAKGQVKEAAKQIVELGKDLGPAIMRTAAYAFFQNCLG